MTVFASLHPPAAGVVGIIADSLVDDTAINNNCTLQSQIMSLTDDGGNDIPVVPNTLNQKLPRGVARADGAISISEALFIARYLVGPRSECTDVVDTACLHSVNAPSVRQDDAFDKLTIANGLFIAQYLLGLRDEFYNLVQ